MKLQFAILSGTCAAAASLFGKLSGLPSLEGLFVLRIVSFLLMVVCNAGVWTLFVKALHQSESSVIPTVISSASNYILSAIAGIIIFNEVTSLLWWVGLGCILMGLYFIICDEEKITNQSTKLK